MSGFKPPELSRFYRLLHARGMDTDLLASLVGRSRTTVTRVLNGSRRRGPAWRAIQPYLLSDERALLDVAHSSTWNARRVARRPHWTPEKRQSLARASSPTGAPPTAHSVPVAFGRIPRPQHNTP